MSDELVLISQARQALASAQSLPEIRRVMEVAKVAGDANRRAAKLAEAQHMAVEVVEQANEAANDAAAVRIEAQAKAGELIRQMAERGEVADHGGDRRSESRSQPATLNDLGVTRSESSRWQQVAAVPEPVRTEYIERTKAERKEITTADLMRHAAVAEAEEQNGHIEQAESLLAPDAQQDIADKRLRLALSTALRDLHSDLLPLQPSAIVRVLTPDRREGLRRSITRLRDWCDRMERALDSERLEVIDGSSR